MRRVILSSGSRENNTMLEKLLASVDMQIKLTDKHMGQLKNKMVQYKSGQGIQNKNLNKLAALLTNYASSYPNNGPDSNNTFLPGLQDFAFTVNEIGHHLQMLMESIDDEVLPDLGEFKIRVKQLQDDLKKTVSVVSQEQIKKKQLQRLQLINNGEPEKISAAEAQLLKAKGEQIKTVKALEQHSQLFEVNMMTGLKKAFLSWVTCELRYHARALELFTDAYNNLSNIDPPNDALNQKSKGFQKKTRRDFDD